MPQIVRQCGLSLLHVQYIAPLVPYCSTAVTVHDILFESHPEYFKKSFVLQCRLLVPIAVRRSAVVFTVSEFSRKQICDIYTIPKEKVHVIRMESIVSAFSLATWDGKLYRLWVGKWKILSQCWTPRARKNHTTLLRAWAQLNVPRPTLVMLVSVTSCIAKCLI